MSHRHRAANRPRLTRLREGDSKRRRVEAYLASLDPGQLAVATASSIVAALATREISISKTYAGRILCEWRFDHRIPAPGERWR